jgi:hypothetical protein
MEKCEVLSLGARRLEHEADHSLPTSAQINEVYSYNSVLTHTSLAQYTIMQRDKYLSILKTHYGDLICKKYSKGHNKMKKLSPA